MILIHGCSRPSLLCFAMAGLVCCLLSDNPRQLLAEGESPANELKQRVLSLVDELEPVTWQHAEQIWDWAEPGYQETKSSKLLANWLKSAGFTIESGVAEIPTAFTATFGEGKPVIAILGEYDALPGLAQQGVPYREQPEQKYYGHGCGHHLFGTASAAAAIGVAEQIKAGRLKGTVRYYGCPAEEGGSAKVFLVRAGLFEDVDVALHWHPGSRNSAGDRSTLARIAVKFRFHGISAHAAGAPDQGRSALDAVELTNFGANLLREHVPDSTRIHYIITSGGDAPNVVPNFAEVYYYVRHPKSEVVRQVYERVVKCAQAGALATETRLEIANEGGIVEILPNQVLADVAYQNLKQLNKLAYTAEETAFALRLQESLEKPLSLDAIKTVTLSRGEVGMGSTDVGDVSWVVPTTGFSTACWVPGTPGHSWQAVACGKTTIARKGMQLAAQTLAATAVELFTNPSLVEQAQQEHQRRIGEKSYEPLVSPEQGPPLDYRKNPANRR